jgi:hypothetical protein
VQDAGHETDAPSQRYAPHNPATGDRGVHVPGVALQTPHVSQDVVQQTPSTQ